MKWTTIVLTVALAVATQLSAQARIKVLHNFGSGSDVNIPAGPLLLDDRGNLYGTTEYGAAVNGYLSGYGSVFELSPQASGDWSEKILSTFKGGENGGFPWGSLVFGASGELYGTLRGSTNAAGAVYSLSPGTFGWTYNILYTDGIALGSGPGVVLDNAGNLYGEIGVGQHLGAIGELSPSSSGWTYTQLYTFCIVYCPDGWNLPAPPIWDSAGNLWGVTTNGGIQASPCVTSEGCGVIFEMTPNGDGSWAYNVVYLFAASSADGQFPNGGLVADAAGNFYGETEEGGAYDQGTVFKLSFVGGQWVETILYDFPNCKQSCYPSSTLAIDKAGNLYGTSDGGSGGSNCGFTTCGIVFKMAPQGNGRYQLTLLHRFIGTDGYSPSGVILDSSGSLFGTTQFGGIYGYGTAFELTP